MSAMPRIGSSNINALRDALVIRTMVGDLKRSISILDCDIATEEASGGISDIADPRYPILARTLSTRRDNLKATVRALELRLAELTTRPASAA